MTNRLKPYKKDFDYSYTCGGYATIELIKTRPELIICIYIHSSYNDKEGIIKLCKENNLAYFLSDKVFTAINQKENSYILAVFRKYHNERMLARDKPHIVLVNPSDMGNLGTIIRTMAGMNIHDLAIIEPAADIYNPKTIRASMGALFRINFSLFRSFEEYSDLYSSHSYFPFMLKATNTPEDTLPCKTFSLIFGNESSGLDEGFLNIGQSVKIPLSSEVDSFNLAIAVGIGAYAFARRNELLY